MNLKKFATLLAKISTGETVVMTKPLPELTGKQQKPYNLTVIISPRVGWKKELGSRISHLLPQLITRTLSRSASGVTEASKRGVSPRTYSDLGKSTPCRIALVGRTSGVSVARGQRPLHTATAEPCLKALGSIRKIVGTLGASACIFGLGYGL